MSEKYQFLVTDDFATGEGRTVSILITRAYPRNEDYDREKSKSGTVDGKFHFEMPPLKEGVTPESIALREFIACFGGWTARLAESYSREAFLDRWGVYLPIHVVKFLEKDDDSGNFKYHSQYHVNYS